MRSHAMISSILHCCHPFENQCFLIPNVAEVLEVLTRLLKYRVGYTAALSTAYWRMESSVPLPAICSITYSEEPKHRAQDIAEYKSTQALCNVCIHCFPMKLLSSNDVMTLILILYNVLQTIELGIWAFIERWMASWVSLFNGRRCGTVTLNIYLSYKCQHLLLFCWNFWCWNFCAIHGTYLKT